MTTVPSYAPSLWVRVCHALPRLDLAMQMRDNIFIPDSWEYQQVTDTCHNHSYDSGTTCSTSPVTSEVPHCIITMGSMG
uniref:Uncharacterized protein n=1 Tax=Scophthalmus maximus TaxID=52904 RepID=A0A8D3CQ74_SCOMX